MTNLRTTLLRIALLLTLLLGGAASALAQGTQLSPPGVRWGTQTATPAPVQQVGYDSITGAPCIVGSTATCLQGLAARGSGAAGGLPAGLKVCDLHVIYDASDNGSITLVTGVAGRRIYICGYVLGTGGTATNLKLRQGSDANCASNASDLTPAYQLAANSQTGALSSFWSGLATTTNGYYVCINASAGNAHQAELFFTVQ